MPVAPAPSIRSPYRGYRFPPEIIAHAVWLYFRFHLSFRDVQDLLAERGVIVAMRRSVSGAPSSVPSLPAGYVGDERGLATSGTSTRSC